MRQTYKKTNIQRDKHTKRQKYQKAKVQREKNTKKQTYKEAKIQKGKNTNRKKKLFFFLWFYHLLRAILFRVGKIAHVLEG